MGDYALAIKPSARKEREALDDPLFARIERKIVTLASNPRPAGCTKLRGHEDIWRIRIGDYRVLYTTNDKRMTRRLGPTAHRDCRRLLVNVAEVLLRELSRETARHPREL